MKSIKSAIVTVPAAALFFLFTACGGENHVVAEEDGGEDTGVDAPDPCEGIDCGGNGQCVVAGGDTAVCMCDAGYHAEGLECVENVPGEECSGVDCSGHGTCVVVQDDTPYPVCICDEGYHNEGDTNCVEDEASCGPGTHLEDGVCVPDENGISCGPGTHEEDGVCVPDEDVNPPIGCGGNDDCAEGEVCNIATGDCIEAAGDVCGLPDIPSGPRAVGIRCEPDDPDRSSCQEGLACVPDVPLSGNPDGTCYTRCDLCAPDCSAGSFCVAWSGPGGICVMDVPNRVGDLCKMGMPCGGGMGCSGYHAGTIFTGTCLHTCTESDPWCPSGEVCVPSVQASHGHIYYCETGTLINPGDACPSGSAWCEIPGRFWFGNCGNYRVGICTKACGSPISGSCWDDVDCVSAACIPDGSIGLGYMCAENRHCATGLSCRDDPYGTSPSGKICLP